MRRRLMIKPVQPEEYIVFADPVVEQICANAWGDGIGLKPSQAAAVTSIDTTFYNATDKADIVSFNEFGEYFTNVTALPANAFNGCSSLESITLPNITSLGNNCFYNCSALIEITIPSTVTSNGYGMFRGCSSLEKMILNAPLNTSSNNTQFSGTSVLRRVDVPNINIWLACRWGGYNSTYLKGVFDVSKGGDIYVNGEKFTTISTSSFPDYNSGTLASGAFRYVRSLTNVTLPTTITSIGDSCFYSNANITDILIPSSVTSIGSSSFAIKSKLVNFICYANISSYNPRTFQSSDSFGDGTGIFYVNSSFSFSSYVTLAFRYIIIHGNVSWGSYLSSGNPWAWYIDGNVTISGSRGLCNNRTSNATRFVEINGTVSGDYNIFYTNGSAGLQSGTVIHLGYNGIACTPTTACASYSRLSKIYVGSGESQAADQAVLDLYLANTDWAAYEDKLDLWYNYEGDYKTRPTIPSDPAA